jgi:hypothetical protein
MNAKRPPSTRSPANGNAARMRHLGQTRPKSVATDDTPARQWVVVIGIDDYQHWPKLVNAVTDARGVHALFTQKLGFDAVRPPLLNAEATADALTALVRDELPQRLKPADSLVLFFAGHGHTRRNRVGSKTVESGYLVPAPARRDQFGELLPIEAILRDLSELPAQHVLVILDCCHSGFALGQAVDRTRGAVEYRDDLAARLSRKVITSARGDQLALDGGPVEGHSLFTGTLVEGFNWGRADLDGNSLVTASELGLYLQQQVGQAAQRRDSRQTPDFGTFGLDERGELVISLRDDNFEALKARANGALLQGRLTEFGELLLQVLAQRPDSPEAQYLRYRACLLACDPAGASDAVDRLLAQPPSLGVVPLSENDLRQLRVQLRFWHDVLALKPGAVAAELGLDTGPDVASLAPAQREPFEGGEISLVRNGHIARFVASHTAQGRAHLYYLTITPHGRLLVGPLLANDEWRYNGLPPHVSGVGAPFKAEGLAGSVTETRVLQAPQRVSALTFGVTVATRSVGPLDDPTVGQLTMQRVWHRVVDQ